MHNTIVKKFLKIAGVLAGLVILPALVIIATLPWMDRWGAMENEFPASFLGDELVPSPRLFYTRGVSIRAAPEEVFPWIAQLGADKGGMYSYTWIEALLHCPQTNADRIHKEWQDLKVGDKVLMCPDENAPPAYEVAIIQPNQVMVLGHQ